MTISSTTTHAQENLFFEQALDCFLVVFATAHSQSKRLAQTKTKIKASSLLTTVLWLYN
jgi:hypothetical protein